MLNGEVERSPRTKSTPGEMHPSKVRVPYHREKLIRSPAGYPVNANQIPVAVTARRGQGLRGKMSLGGAGSAAWARAPAKERTTTVSATLPHCQKRKIEGGQVPGRAGTVELNSHLDETGPA